MSTDPLTTSDLSHWPILQVLRPDFLTKMHRFFVYNQGRSALLLTTEEEKGNKISKVYSFGQNQFGCLGLGLGQNVELKEPVEMVPLCGKAIRQITEGLGQVMVLTKEGELFGWGCNGCGQVGCGGTQDQTKPIRVATSVMGVACGIDHSAWVLNDGSVWCCGDDAFHQMAKSSQGHGAMPAKVLETIGTKTITKLGCGAGSCLALTNTSELYHWGHFYPQVHSSPTRVVLPKDLLPVSITSGHQDFLIIDSDQNAHHCYYTEDFEFHCDPLRNLLMEPVNTVVFANIHNQGCYCLELSTSGRVVIWNPMKRELTETEVRSVSNACAVYCKPSVTPLVTTYLQ